MEELSYILKVMLKRISYVDFLNGKYNCMDFDRKMLEHAVRGYMTSYSDTEIRNMLESFYDFLLEYGKFWGDKSIDDGISVYDAIFRFVDTMLISKNNEIMVKYEKILQWRMITQDLGEELFVAAFLARQDLKNGRYSKSFDWPFVIGHNNIQLRRLTESGMAENHFHLWGSAPYFLISWIWLMNHMEEVQNSEKAGRINENTRFLFLSNGKDGIEGDTRKNCLQASLIRLYLYSLLTNEQIEIGEYCIEAEILLPWISKFTEKIENLCEYDHMDLYHLVFRQERLRPYRYVLETILVEAVDFSEFVREHEEVRLCDILKHAFERQSRIYLRDCALLFSTAEYKKIWDRITYEKVKYYLNNYDVMCWHIDEIQEALFRIAVSQKDYFLNYVDKEPGRIITNNYILEGERKLLYEMFRRIETKDYILNVDIYNWFYAYLLIKEKIRGEMIQSNNWVGFENFSIYRHRSGLFAKGVFWEKLKAKMAITSCLEQNIISLEVRISPYDTAIQNFQEINFLDDIIGEDKNKYYYVFHFIKKQDQKLTEDWFCSYRHKELREEIHKKTMALLEFRNRYPKTAMRVRGIDAASQEIGCRPEVFGQCFRTLHSHTCYRLTKKGYKKLPQLCATYHVGEDFLDVADGLRAIDEAIVFLDLNCGDRLGHCLALGVDVLDWYKCKNNQISISKQEYLDNIVWLYHMLARYNIPDTDNIKTEIELSYHRLFKEIYGQHMNREYIYAIQRKQNKKDTKTLFNFDIHAYYDSWKLRGDSPTLYREGFFRNDDRLRTIYGRNAVNEHFPEDFTIRYNSEVAMLYHFYHYNSDVRREGQKIKEFKVSGTYIKAVEQVQKALQWEISRRGIGIETNPSSNYMIGTFKRYAKHPIIRFYNKGLVLNNSEVSKCPQIWVSINTDDQGVFNIKLENEYALLARALEMETDEYGKPIYSKTMIYDWLDEIRKMGIRQSFLESKNN